MGAGTTDPPATAAVSQQPPPLERARCSRHVASARGQLTAFFFFAAFIFLLYQLYLVFASFVGPIMWAAILALVFYPLYETVLTWVRGRATIAAVLLTVLVTVAVVVPTVSLSSIVTRESVSLYQRITGFVRSGRMNETLGRIRDSRVGRAVARLSDRGWELDYGAIVQRTADAASRHVTSVARNLAALMLNFSIMIFTLFFLFRDGQRMYRGLHDLIPMEPEHKDVIFARLYETLSAVMRGLVVTAVTQGVLTWIGLWIVDMPYAAFLSVTAGVLSFVPFIGPAGVWLPCALYLGATGDVARGVFMFAYGALVISMIDNVLRPLLIGGQARLHTLFLFFAILGGLQAYGVVGIFLGPVLLGTVVAFITIYREQYAIAETPSAS